MLAILTMLVASCRREPDYVLSQDRMASLLADIYVAESVTELNRQQYPTDSSRKLLKQSVLAHHGVTAQQFDTSMIWYGHNMDRLVKVYDKSTEILINRRNRMTHTIAVEGDAGADSTNLWYGAPYMVWDDRYPTSFIRAQATNDGSWAPGDQFVWRLKLIDDGVRNIRWSMLAEYDDGSTDWLNVTTSSDKWNNVTFVADTVKQIVAIRGLCEINRDSYTNRDRDIWIDSIQLVRKASTPDNYQMMRGRVRSYPPY